MNAINVLKYHPRWHLIKTVKPDVLIITKETKDKYTKEDMKEMASYCGKVVILNPMAVTSTSAKIRLLQLNIAKRFEKALIPKIADMISDTLLNQKSKNERR